jgi:hypothetical protein
MPQELRARKQIRDVPVVSRIIGFRSSSLQYKLYGRDDWDSIFVFAQHEVGRGRRKRK